jgi:formamidopyrimidine-DNA glycosylase
MPELPELEVTRDGLRTAAMGRRVVRADVRHPACLKTFDPPLEAIVGRHVTGVERQGKFICLTLGHDLHVCVHLMLDGRFAFFPSGRNPAKSHLLSIGLDSGQDLRVTETSTKHRVRVFVAADLRLIPAIATQGDDPLGRGFTPERLEVLLATRSQTVKSFLTDQHLLTGIGNAYSDEILHEARLSPFQLSRRLTAQEASRLHAAIGSVLRAAIEQLSRLDHIPDRRDRTFLKVHSRRGMPCPVCGTAVEYVSYTDSNTYYCPKCQTDGRKLADRRLSRLLK